MAANSNALELFKRSIGAKITELTGLSDEELAALAP